MHLFQKNYQPVRNNVLAVCAKPVPVWGKKGKLEGNYGEKNYLDMSFCFRSLPLYTDSFFPKAVRGKSSNPYDRYSYGQKPNRHGIFFHR